MIKLACLKTSLKSMNIAQSIRMTVQ